jgi:hypothetical protein
MLLVREFCCTGTYPALTLALVSTQDISEALHSLLQREAPADALAQLSRVRGIWAFVSLQMACANPTLKVAKVLQYAEDVQYLEVLQQVGSAQPNVLAWM